MQYDEIMQATMLLCCHFNKNEVKNFKPLSGSEYSKLAQWLYQNKLSPADLLSRTDEVLSKWHDPKSKITSERLKQLLDRGVSMAFALEKWSKQGILVISRASEFYPKAIKKHLGEQRPPILFVLGNVHLLSQAGLGFVGSRSITESDEFFASNKAKQAIEEGYVVISGAAKGVDQAAMQAALESGGQSIGILADGIYTNETRRIFINYLRQGTLALMSPFFPEAGFNVGSAMARNKFIYTMSEAVIVVKSDKDKGGTWTGAKENLNKKWVPLLVRDIAEEGNQALIQMGGIAFGQQKVPFIEFLSTHRPVTEKKAIPNSQRSRQQSDLRPENLDMFEQLGQDHPSENYVEVKAIDGLNESPVVDTLERSSELEVQSNDSFDESRLVQVRQKYGTIFELFLNTLISLSENKTPFFIFDDIKKYFPELQDTQIKKWLKELENEGCLLREGRIARYTLLNQYL